MRRLRRAKIKIVGKQNTIRLFSAKRNSAGDGKSTEPRTARILFAEGWSCQTENASIFTIMVRRGAYSVSVTLSSRVAKRNPADRLFTGELDLGPAVRIMQFKNDLVVIRNVWRKVTVAGFDTCEVQVSGDSLANGICFRQGLPKGIRVTSAP